MSMGGGFIIYFFVVFVQFHFFLQGNIYVLPSLHVCMHNFLHDECRLTGGIMLIHCLHVWMFHFVLMC